MTRTDKTNYYLDIAQTVCKRSTCLRRMYGAIIVLNDEIIATGYNGAPRGRANCVDIGKCLREAMKIPSGERYELCRSVHAEANLINAQATPCSMCRRLIINAGIETVVCRVGENEYTVTNVSEWVEQDDSLYLEDK